MERIKLDDVYFVAVVFIVSNAQLAEHKSISEQNLSLMSVQHSRQLLVMCTLGRRSRDKLSEQRRSAYANVNIFLCKLLRCVRVSISDTNRERTTATRAVVRRSDFTLIRYGCANVCIRTNEKTVRIYKAMIMHSPRLQRPSHNATRPSYRNGYNYYANLLHKYSVCIVWLRIALCF